VTLDNPLIPLVRHALRTRYEDLPPEVVAKAKIFLLDTIGVGVAGSAGALVDNLIAVAKGWGTGDEATVWVTGERLPAPAAAIANAYQIHCLEYDCVHERAVLHPMATILAALSAYCERRSAQGRPVTGRELIPALAVGVDAATMLGMAATGPIRFFRPAICGAFGCAAAIAQMEGFDEETAVNAFGILYGQVSGTLQPHLEGVPLLGLQIGFNARASITACDLAKAGFIGPKDILTGRYGFFPLYEDGQAGDLESTWAGLGRDWQIANLAHKPYPSGRLTHGTVHGLRELESRFGIDLGDIEHLTAYVPPLVHRLVGRPDMPDPAPNYAKLCIPFVAGSWVAKRRCDVPDFLGDELRNPAVHDFAARVTVLEDGNPDQNAMSPQRFIARMKNGQTHEVTLPWIYGHPEVPLTEAENEAKFRRCWAYARGPLDPAGADKVAAFVDRIEEQADVAALVPLLVRPG